MIKVRDWSNYQSRSYDHDPNKFLVDFLKEHRVRTAIDLGCGSGNDSVNMVKSGIKVTAIDGQLNRNYILDRLNGDEKDRVSFIESTFEEVELPTADLVAAIFSLPFCERDCFETLWNKIYVSINEGGYFVGQLFGDRDDWNAVDYINTFTIEEVKRYLKKYKLITFEEVEYVREYNNKKWHLFNIAAQKV
ncbi:MAG: class I SAM-dependent methyltransferase [Clostridia bacterium]|nr:class I SAM-dependent methyltransferase [Clostridia bacterium]